MKTLIFKIQLADDKKVSREIEAVGNTTLYKLAETITRAYDFYFDHCFGFYSNIDGWYNESKEQYDLFTDLDDVEPTGAKSVKKTKIADVWKKTGDKMLFLFDYGDKWYFIVTFKRVGEKITGEKYPRILVKKGKSPEQYPSIEDER
ncbi:plasmid pRiA4b ORF-3 family protein [Patescibacteria group bacterium]|nr:plasmid pRiA4b ORF-3 family protein [Patescibacteria group bacterium]